MKSVRLIEERKNVGAPTKESVRAVFGVRELAPAYRGVAGTNRASGSQAPVRSFGAKSAIAKAAAEPPHSKCRRADQDWHNFVGSAF